MRPWLFALGVFIIHSVSPLHVQTDSMWAVPVALSILHHGDTTLDEYTEALARSRHGVEERAGHAYNGFPLGASLVALPFLAATDAVTALAPTFAPFARWRRQSFAEGALDVGFFDTTGVLIGSVCVALSTLLVVLIARARVFEPRSMTPWVIGFIVAFASPAWSTASRSLWQHGPAMVFLSLALWAWLCGASRWRAVLCGAALGFAFVCRPTAAIPVVVVTLAHGRRALWVIAGGLLVALPWCLFNLHVGGSVLPGYYLPERLDSSGPLFFEALAGNLVSAGRGLLIFCPVAILCVTGVKRDDRFSLVAAATMFVHWVVISRFPHWWAGHSFGPRLFAELTPFWALLLVPWLDSLFAKRRWQQPAGIVTAVLIAMTVVIHARGALSKAPWSWNGEPVNVDDQPSRLWDYSDLQFLR